MPASSMITRVPGPTASASGPWCPIAQGNLVGEPPRPRAGLPGGRGLLRRGSPLSGHVISLGLRDLNFRGMPCNVPHLPEATEQAHHGHPAPRLSKFRSGQQGARRRGAGNACVSRRCTPAIVGSSSGPGSASMPASLFGHTTRRRASSGAASDSGLHAATGRVQLGPPAKPSSH